MLNEMIVCEGYTNAYTRYPFKREYMDRVRACERQAREQGKGLWGEGLAGQAAPASSVRPTASAPEGAIKGNRQSKIYHLPSCPDYSRLSPAHVVTFATEADAKRAGYRKAKNLSVRRGSRGRNTPLPDTGGRQVGLMQWGRLTKRLSYVPIFRLTFITLQR